MVLDSVSDSDSDSKDSDSEPEDSDLVDLTTSLWVVCGRVWVTYEMGRLC